MTIDLDAYLKRIGLGSLGLGLTTAEIAQLNG